MNTLPMTPNNITMINTHVIDSLPLGVNVVDHEGKILYANEYIQKNYPDDIRGSTCWDIFPDNKQQCAQCPLAQHSKRDASGAFEVSGYFGSKSYRISYERITLDGKQAVIEMFQDITQEKQAEAKLQKLSRAIEQSGDHVIITDRDGEIEYVNKAFEQVTGYSYAEVIGKTPRILKSDRHDPDYYQALWQIILAGQVYRGISINKKKNGELYHEEKTITPLKNAMGEITHFVSTGRDITERIMIEAALQKSETSLKEAQRVAQVGSWEFDIVNDTLAWSDEVFRIFGIDRKEFGANYEAFVQAIHPDDREMVNSAYTESVKNGIPYSIDHRLLMPDGTIKVVHEQCETYYDDAGKPIRSIGTVQDITEQKRGETERLRLMTIIEQSLNEIYVFDTVTLKFEYANAVSMRNLGYRKDELYARTPLDLIPEFTETTFRAMLAPLLRHERSNHVFQTTHRRSDGSFYQVEVHLQLVDAGLRPVFLAVLYDITERKRAEEALIAAKERAEQSDKLKEAFIANISHEIRTPLNIILGYSNLIEAQFEDKIPAEEKFYFDTLRSGGNRLMRTVDHILNISRLQVGDFPLQPETINLSSLVKKLVDEYQDTARAKSVRLTFSNSIDAPEIRVDEYCITQAILNLIDNALKYTKKGFVDVLLEHTREGNARLIIHDSGVGMSEEYMESLFQAYSQEEFGYSRGYEGIGLGLALVKKYLDLNGVQINVQSTKGTGTKFTLIFPALPNPAQGITTQEIVEQEKQHGKKHPDPELQRIPNILVVEDDVFTQEYMRIILRDKYSVEIAATTSEAWEVLRSQRIDCILMDLALSDEKDGIELTKELRSVEAFVSLPIIALTAHAFDQDRQHCLEAGCNGFIAKPIDTAKLLNLLDSVMAVHR